MSLAPIETDKPTRYVVPKSKSKMRKGEVAITHEMSADLMWLRIRVLGLDPSLGSTGWSVVDFLPMQRPILLAHGTIRTDPPGGDVKTNMRNIIERSRIISTAVETISLEWPVDFVVIELPIPARGGVGSGHMGPGSQSGSMIVAVVYNAAPYPPSQIELIEAKHVKLVTANNGDASKQEVKEAVTEWLGFLPRTNTDVSDSIAATIAFALEHLTEVPQ